LEEGCVKSFPDQYDPDSEFRKLLAREPHADLTRAALELARDAEPRLDFDLVLDWIRARGDELRGPIVRTGSEEDALSLLCKSLGEVLRGDAGCYERAEGSYLHRVIETGVGLPISLSVLYMDVAAEVGLELEGVAAPLHFLTRLEAPAGPLFIDAYERGRIMTESECVQWLAARSGLPVSQIESSLAPATVRSIVTRMLHNLKRIHMQQQDWRLAYCVQHRLSALNPAAYTERRDLAIIAIKARRPADAVTLLESCLRTCPEGEKDFLAEQLRKAQAALAQYN
jgi:regulator of sirC expression with transglutaminase-like and TPR domain